ncbi:hypothetical protein AB6A23_05355 [Paenibacillus tarimensis]
MLNHVFEQEFKHYEDNRNNPFLTAYVDMHLNGLTGQYTGEALR